MAETKVESMSAKAQSTGSRLVFFDALRAIAMLGVVLFHAAAAYSTVAPYWAVHDGSTITADLIREIFDVFIMPVFFFLAGYFALPSLQKKGSGPFLKDKFLQLGSVWLLVVFVVLPFSAGKFSNFAGGFISAWINSMKSTGTVTLGLFSGSLNHMHFWFISLLLYFFIIFTFLYAVKNRLFGNDSIKPAASRNSILLSILAFGGLTALGYFVSLLFVPDMSWLIVQSFVQFEVSKLFLFACHFGLGVYSYEKGWFSGGNAPLNLRLWVPLTLLTAVGFMVAGQPVFDNPGTTPGLSALVLLGFAILRELFSVSALFLMISLAVRFFNRPSGVIKSLAVNSYSMYLIHFFFVFILQDILVLWADGPPLVKLILVFLTGTGLSWLISRYALTKFPRASFAAVIVLFFILPLILAR